MKEIKQNVKGNAEIIVTENELAVTIGSGSLKVLATPVMAMLMEKSACECLAEYLENDETTVGTELNIKHVSATPCGMKVTAKAELLEVSGREFTFSIKAFDECGIIGEGIHKRFLVYGEKFTQKANSKRQ